MVSFSIATPPHQREGIGCCTSTVYLFAPGAKSRQMQPLRFVDNRLKNILRHFRIEAAALGPRFALREHGFAVPRIAYAYAIVFELQRGKRVFLAPGEQPD